VTVYGNFYEAVKIGRKNKSLELARIFYEDGILIKRVIGARKQHKTTHTS
jgi:hypothetical protein